MRCVLAAGILLSLCAAPAFAQKSITVTGCVAKGVEFGCLVLRTATGKSYNISAAQPVPMVGTYGTVTGTLQPGRITFCQQGEVIDPATWKKRGKFCPNAKR